MLIFVFVDYFLENLVADARAVSNFQAKNIGSHQRTPHPENIIQNELLSEGKKELILPSSQKKSVDFQGLKLFISEPTIFIDGDLISFTSQGENPEESYDLAQSLDYHLVYSE